MADITGIAGVAGAEQGAGAERGVAGARAVAGNTTSAQTGARNGTSIAAAGTVAVMTDAADAADDADAAQASTRRELAFTILKPVVFAVLLALATMAGRIPIPGTPVPITLQTFVVMVAALTMTWRQAGAAIALYLAAGAAGLPVFAGGMSTAALFGPSAGFLIGFLPAAIVTALLKGNASRQVATTSAGLRTATAFAGSDGLAARTRAGSSDSSAVVRALRVALTVLRYFVASFIGCIALDYAIGFTVQSAITGVPFSTVALASMGFVAGDLIKAAVASLVIAGVTSLKR